MKLFKIFSSLQEPYKTDQSSPTTVRGLSLKIGRPTKEKMFGPETLQSFNHYFSSTWMVILRRLSSALSSVLTTFEEKRSQEISRATKGKHGNSLGNLNGSVLNVTHQSDSPK